jgi:E3 ubiquitin-protein ligase HERC2
MKIDCFVFPFQLHAAISHQVDPEFLGLGLGSVLLNSLKQTVVTLASSVGVLSTVQSAAQAVLQSGWSVLLPTAEERARALSALLPCTGGSGRGMGVGAYKSVGRAGTSLKLAKMKTK